MPNTELADLVLCGGRIFTADGAGSWARGIAVRDGRIAAVGTDAEAMALAGPRTRVIDLRGRTATPGFGDSHVHPTHGGLARIRCELHESRGRERYLEIIAAYAASHPDVPWILGGGWSLADFPGGLPRREDLDRVVPERPVYLPNRDGHDVWVNSKALELAGITRDTPDPAHGRIARDPDGTPLGTLHEGASDLMEPLLPATTEADLRAALLESQRYLHSLGITNWQDAWLTPHDQHAYLALAASGELTARVVGAHWWERERGTEQVEEIVERRAGGSLGRFNATSVKLMVDGIVENYTASMLDPYLDGHGHATDNRGMDFIEPELLKEVVVRIDALGLQPHFHALGDRAVRQALDAVEAARRANGWTDTRPTIAHIQFVHPDDVPRFRLLGALPNAQPYWAVEEDQMTELTLPFVSSDAAGHQYPFRSLLRDGATLVMGSDWSVSTPDPMLEMEVAVNRVSPETRDAAPFLPDERIALAEALRAFTAGSAYAQHLDEAGVLEAGRLADFVVLDRDLFDRGAGPIGEARVVGTFIGGEAVFEAPGLD
jgi:predicted amidohydrolase YtcJ